MCCTTAGRCAGWGVVLLCVLWLAQVVGTPSAMALEPIVINPDQDQIEITTRGDLYQDRGDSLQVETAPSAGGITGRVSVNAAMRGTNPHWIVFALRNPTNEPLERLLTADRYNIVGSGAIWPDLDAQRIKSITPSIGFVPERITSDRADVFRVTLEPGQTITYVVELSSDRFARVYLWEPLEYELKLKDRQLFHGILLGLTGLLAIFLTAIFAANHKLIFPAAALVAWCVLAYLCVDFGFFHKLFNLKPEDNAVYRAAAESAMAASFVIFIYVFLRLALWNSLVRMLGSVWILSQLALVALAVIDPRLAATFARLSFAGIALCGSFFTLFLALRGQDRAMALVPTWMLFCVWVFSAAVLLTGQLSGELAVSGLVAFLVLILISIGFTITQFAFRTIEPQFGSSPTEAQQRALAVDGAGAAVWLWNARRDEISVGATVEETLGLKHGELSASTDDFVRHIHPTDRERFKLTLWSVQERAGGRIRSDFRLRHADNSYRWFELEAASIAGNDPRVLRCVGLLRDVTESKRAHERLLHDAVHDNLTNLPNRSLFLDRLANTIRRAGTDDSIRPAVLFIDLDKFKSVNSSFGLLVGDSLLLTVARRLQRHLQPEDTLSRVGGDQFAMIIMGRDDAQELAGLAERLRLSLRSPIKIAGQEIILTGSMGIAIYDGETNSEAELLKNAEIAMYRAKRSGSDHIELFRSEMRADRDDRVEIESDLRKALEKNQFKVLYQPIYTLSTEELAGFEALIRWQHPKYGLMNPTRFVPIAEESDLIVRIGSQVLLRAARDAAKWQQVMTTRDESPLFVSVNVSSRQLFRQDLVQEIRHILGQNLVARGALRLEVTESLVMENPEQAVEILGWLQSAGAELILDDFGTGYSSLSYLQRFPFDGIKIDQSFIKASSKSDGSGSILVRSMVAMAHELGLTVVAEGVEDPETAAFLRSVGSEYAQGYFYGEPITQREVLQMLRMLEKSERKLKPRKLFKTRRRDKQDHGDDKKTTANAGRSHAQENRQDKGQKDNRPSEAPTPPSVGERPAAAIKAGASVEALPNSAVRPLSTHRKAADGDTRPMPVTGNSAAADAAPRPAPQPPPLPQTGQAQDRPLSGTDTGRPPVQSTAPPASPQTSQPSHPPQQRPTAVRTPAGAPPSPASTSHQHAPPPVPANTRPSVAASPPPPPAGKPTQASPPAGKPNGTHRQPPPAPSGAAANGRTGPAPPVTQNGSGTGANKGDSTQTGQTSSGIDYSKLPPNIAESLRRLAGDAPQPPVPPPVPAAKANPPDKG